MKLLVAKKGRISLNEQRAVSIAYGVSIVYTRAGIASTIYFPGVIVASTSLLRVLSLSGHLEC